MRILVTGGAGFIGSAVARRIVEPDAARGSRLRQAHLRRQSRLAGAGRARPAVFASSAATSAIRAAVDAALQQFRPHWVMNLAAESHVDRSIDGPAEFIQTNVVGTGVMLRGRARLLAGGSTPEMRDAFRFHHISTDEVFGSLGAGGPVPRGHALCAEFALFRLQGGLRPSGARLAPHLRPADGADQLLQQLRALSFSREADPADDPQRARRQAAAGLRQGRERARLAVCRGPRRGAADGRRARAGSARATTSAGDAERRNLDVVEAICDLVDELAPERRAGSRRELITFVADRPGHDLRYAIDASKIERELGWRPRHDFRERVCARRCSGISTTRPGGETSARAPIAASGSAWRSERGLACRSKTPPFAGVKMITPKKFGDHRGFFSEVYSRKALRGGRARSAISCRTTIPFRPKSAPSAACISRSPPFAQDKLVRVARGRDPRRRRRPAARARRPSAGMSRSNCRRENWRQLLVPVGFAHGFCTLGARHRSALQSDATSIRPRTIAGLAFDDPALGIDWGVDPAKRRAVGQGPPASAARRSSGRFRRDDDAAPRHGNAGPGRRAR